MPQTTPPSAALVRRLAHAALGGEHPPDVRPVDEGGEHSTWWAGTHRIVRFALDEAGARRQRREIALRELVRPHLGVEVPASIATGEWASGLTFTVDTRLPGESGEHRPVTAAGEADLARLLAGLRSVPTAEAAALGLPRCEPRSLTDLRDTARAAAERLAADGEFNGAPLPGPTPPGAERVLVHGDLKGEHLMVDAEGRVLGVLDWTDAMIGDPAEDVAGLAISIGAPAAARVASAAGYDRDTGTRGIALARLDTLLRLADRLYGSDDSPLPLLRAQLARAWEA